MHETFRKYWGILTDTQIDISFWLGPSINAYTHSLFTLVSGFKIIWITPYSFNLNVAKNISNVLFVISENIFSFFFVSKVIVFILIDLGKF